MITLGAAGSLVQIYERSALRPGIRPICQATKLLDRDPIVRRMAEQDVLVMGRAAKPYLDQVRATARPKLQQAIDPAHNAFWTRAAKLRQSKIRTPDASPLLAWLLLRLLIPDSMERRAGQGPPHNK